MNHLSMSEYIKFPSRVYCNMRVFFDEPGMPHNQRVGLLTEIKYGPNDDMLYVRGGISDDGLHNDLASRLDSGKLIALPSAMASSEGTVRAWRDAGDDGRIGIFASRNDKLINPDALFSPEDTDRQLRMAGLALGILLQSPQDDLVKFTGKNWQSIIDQSVLASAERHLRYDIYS